MGAGLDERERTDGAGGDTGTAASAGRGVDGWEGPATGREPEPDRACVALVVADAAGDPVHREAGLRGGRTPGPRRLRTQRTGFAGGDAFGTEGAGPGSEVEARKSVLAPGNDPLGAGPGAIAALGTEVMERGFGHGPVGQANDCMERGTMCSKHLPGRGLGQR